MKNTSCPQGDGLLTMPISAKICRFKKAIENEVSEDAFKIVMQGSEDYNALKPSEMANWWRSAVERLEKEIGKGQSIEVMNFCGLECCGDRQRKAAQRLMKDSKSIKEFLDKFINHGVNNGELGYVIIDESTFIIRYNRCFCGQVKELEGNFENDTYCHCSIGFNKQYFQAAFNKPVEVQLIQSILNWGECCEFIISIK